MHNHQKAPQDLVTAYPRGQRELLGPYTSMFGPKEAYEWFTSRGVKLKCEEDGRMFPITDSSQTIVDCLRREADKVGVSVKTGWKVIDIEQIHLHEEEEKIEEGESKNGGGKSTLSQPPRLRVTVQEKTKEGTETHTHTLLCNTVLLATGSSREGHALAERLGHTIIDPVPSLFTLELHQKKDTRTHTHKANPLEGLAGISVSDVEVSLLGPTTTHTHTHTDTWKDILKQSGIRAAAAGGKGKGKGGGNAHTHTHTNTHSATTPLTQRGPLLITHTGLSGPAILRLSSFSARVLHTLNYQATISVDWVPEIPKPELLEKLKRAQKAYSKKGVGTFCPLFVTHTHTDTDTKEGGEGKMPRRLWARIVEVALERVQTQTQTQTHTSRQKGEGGGGGGGSGSENVKVNTPTSTQTQTQKGVTTWGSLSPKALLALTEEIKGSVYETTGKGTFKEEFVTCGGISLKEVDFRTWGSKKVPGLYFAGEVMDIDGVTGGHNFGSCWCGGYASGRAMGGLVAEDMAIEDE